MFLPPYQKTSDVFETSDVWEKCRGERSVAPTKHRVKGRTRRDRGRIIFRTLQDIIIPKPISLPQTELILVRHRMSARHPMSGKPIVR